MVMDLPSLETSCFQYVKESLARFDDEDIPCPNYKVEPRWSADEFDWTDETDINRVLDLVRDRVELPNSRMATGRLLGPISFAPSLSACTGPLVSNLITNFKQSVFEEIENAVMTWIRVAIHYPEEAVGCFTSGGTMAIMVCILAARVSSGLLMEDTDRSVVYITTQTHIATRKGLSVVGMRNVCIRCVALDKDFRMSPQDLRRQIDEDKKNGLVPFCVVATLGNVKTGAVDDVETIATIANEHGIWCHVDASVGGCLMMGEAMKDHIKGMSLSSSVSTSLHKGMAQPIATGVALIRHPVARSWNKQTISPAACKDAGSSRGVQTRGSIFQNPMESSTTSTTRAVQVWLSLKLTGTAFIEKLVENALLQRQYLQEVFGKNPAFVEVGRGECSMMSIKCTGDTQEEADQRTTKLDASLLDGQYHVIQDKKGKGIALHTGNFRTRLQHLRGFLTNLQTKYLDMVGTETDTGRGFPSLPEMEQVIQDLDDQIREHDVRVLESSGQYVSTLLRDICQAGVDGVHASGNPAGTYSLDPGQTPYSTSSTMEHDTIRIGSDPTPKNALLPILDMLGIQKNGERGAITYLSSLCQLLSRAIGVMVAVRDRWLGATIFEDMFIGRISGAFGMDAGSRGALYNDVTTATISGLVAAREKLQIRGHDVRRAVMYVCADNCVDLSQVLEVAWLNGCHQRVLQDSSALTVHRFRTTLEEDIQCDRVPQILVACLDLADTSDMEEHVQILREVCAVAHQHDMWTHLVVRGGIRLCLDDVPSLKGLRGWLDSIVVDLQHTTLHPTGLAAILVDDGAALVESLAVPDDIREVLLSCEAKIPWRGDKWRVTDEISPHSWSLELSRPCRSLPLWITLKTLGAARAREEL